MKTALAFILALAFSSSALAADWSVREITQRGGKRQSVSWSASALTNGKTELAVGEARIQVPAGIASDLRDRVAKFSMKPSHRDPGCERYVIFESSLGKSRLCAAEVRKSSEAVTLLADLERLRAKARR